ncbi:MAG: YdbL family protein [Gammaproteobacteria bacterium]|nr:MAG: YdbL family protein [Gammaproteobacteria bacterium]
MHTIRMSSVLGMLLFITACVTINVYFPTAQAVEAADQIIRGVYGEEQAPAAPAEQPAPGSSLQLPDNDKPLLIGVLEWLVAPAQANADINIQSPAINTIRASMEARFAALKPFYDNGSVGMTADGLITVRDLNAVPLRDRKTVNTLVADENRDRNALYKEIARANGHPEWEADIRSTFAKRWIANAPAGWWYQEGGWKKK